MNVYEELQWRGLVNQITHDDLPKRLAEEQFTLYCGFDPTADSLHIGSLLPIMTLVHFQRAGHRPLALVGGGTGLIGDPSGKTDERTLLSREQVEANCVGIRGQLERFLTFEGPSAAVMLNNADWLCGLPLIEFLRDVGKFFSVNVMLSRESVKQRLESRDHGISYTEFSYSLLQAYDFLELCRRHDCRLQVGGSDQWGNIVAGMDLTRRLEQKDTFGLTIPLVTKADGSKFGKSEGGNIWLDASRTSPYRFYQFWLNQSDEDVVRYLKFFTLLDRATVEELEKQTQEAPHQRAAQKRLAEEVTRLVHGDAALTQALKATEAMFGGDLGGLDEAALLDIFSEVPSGELPKAALAEGGSLLEALTSGGVFASKSEARRMIQNGGLYVNNLRIEDENAKLEPSHCLAAGLAVVRKGKKNYHLLRFV
ncbi:MAG: tyrosine--tRNA ligase [Candidatus Hydrogenedens sp.]|nr:tyrosine--tRNA ligase [Candidatus Hydrogenedens sp.]